MFKTALNKNIIPHTWKLANIVPITKPYKDTDKGTSYMPISLLSVIAKTLEKSLLPYITANIHTLIRKLLQTNIPCTIIKFIANYIKGRKAYTTYINHTSKQRQFKTGFHKVASFHPHYLTFIPQTYHHPVHRFRLWPMQTTSQSHTQVRVQPINTHNHTYTKFLPGQNKTTSY